MKKKRLFKAFMILLFSLVLVELIGRYYGLNQLTLYREDKDFEYIAQPNQHTFLYRNKFSTNEFSMRSDPILPEDTSTVLMIGDSIIFGTNRTDQDSLASSVLEKMLTKKFKRKIRVLNISAPSWGPDNGAAYVKKYGTFHAKAIVLVYSSHDAHDNMTFRHVLGKQVYYARNNYFAWQTIFQRTVLAVYNKFFWKATDDLLISSAKEFNPGFASFDSLCTTNHIALFVYLHSTVEELNNKKYERGGNEIIDFCRKNKMQLIPGIENERANLYVDGLHFTNHGNKFLADLLFPRLSKCFQ